MIKLQGKTVFAGIAIGPAAVLEKKDSPVKREHVDNVEAELLRLEQARERVLLELAELYERALSQVGESGSEVFGVHQMMLEDEDYSGSIKNIIESEKVNAEYAAAVTGDNFSEMFESMDDEYMKARAADIKDITERLIKTLSGKKSSVETGDVASVIIAEDLTPGETVQLDKSKVLAFVTRYGSTNSHTAILARTMNIPALIGVDYPEDIDKKPVIVDGNEGALYIDPDEETIKKYESLKEAEKAKKQMLAELKGKPTETRGGRRIKLYANIGGVSDVAYALQNDAEGIGLFRSEFLYLSKEDYPDEEEQFQVYKTVLQNMAGKKVIIRTLDIGADKKIDYFKLDEEENPAMGFRAIRICFERPEIFKTQLRAIFRAGVYGNAAVMYPMIISVEELREIKSIVEEVKAELSEQGIPFKPDIEQGIMIETPAAVMISDLLAKEADFFSIGTNDLTQYTLAIDRQNSKLDRFYDPHHEAVLRMIETVVKNAHAEGIWAGICGELGADVSLTERFVEMGVDELSVSPTSILPIRKIIRNIE